MDKTIVFNCINAYFNNKSLSFPIDVDKKEVLNLFKEQALLPFLFLVYKDNDFKKFYIASMIIQDNFLRAQKEIDKAFTDIKHLYFKGSVMYQYYPDFALRTRGDIDFYVSDDDYQKAKDILFSLGYSKSHDDAEHHSAFVKEGLELELHHLMCSSEYKEASNVFSNPFVNAVNIEGNSYHFTETYELLFTLFHYSKHFVNGGAGVRPLIDVYLLLKKGDINKELLKEKLVYMKLLDFYYVVINAIESIFKEQLDDVPEKNIDTFLAFILDSGIHGLNNNIYEVQMISQKRNKFIFLLKKLFIPYSVMKSYYPCLKKLPVLLPFCYILRFFRLWKTKKKIKKVIKSNKKEALDVMNMFEELGLTR